jgi:hypothetical protein
MADPRKSTSTPQLRGLAHERPADPPSCRSPIDATGNGHLDSMHIAVGGVGHERRRQLA